MHNKKIYEGSLKGQQLLRETIALAAFVVSTLSDHHFHIHRTQFHHKASAAQASLMRRIKCPFRFGTGCMGTRWQEKQFAGKCQPYSVWATLVLGTGKKRERKNMNERRVKNKTRDEHCFCLVAEIRQKTGMIVCSRDPAFKRKSADCLLRSGPI